MPSVFPFQIIQGGMGAGVSAWQLARAVSRQGELGVLSGTGLGVMLVRRLQSGDLGGHMRRALNAFPFPQVSQRIFDRYFIEGGKSPTAPFTLTPMPILNFATPLVELTVVANFVEVYLAKEGHHGLVGMNYLEKIQTPPHPPLPLRCHARRRRRHPHGRWHPPPRPRSHRRPRRRQTR